MLKLPLDVAKWSSAVTLPGLASGQPDWNLDINTRNCMFQEVKEHGLFLKSQVVWHGGVCEVLESERRAWR